MTGKETGERRPIIVCKTREEILAVLRHEMKLASVSQQELAEHMGVAYVTVNRLLTGKTPLSLEHLYTVLGYLGIGVALAPPRTGPTDVTAQPRKRKTPVDLGVTVPDLIRAGKIAVGDILNSNQGSFDAVAEVGLGGVLILEDGNEYTGLSSAAKEIRGTTTNGWAFWALNGRSLDAVRKEYLAESK